MSREIVPHNKPVSDQLHPRVYGVAVGLVAWFALMAWVLFDRRSDVSLLLTFVCVLFLVAVLVPCAIFLVWKKYRMPHEQRPQQTSFHDWKDGDFRVWGAKLHGAHAAIDVLLPLIAVSLGLTTIGIVFVIVRALALS
jgi:amino acid transporter